jgi:periplasmic copper chaperone A
MLNASRSPLAIALAATALAASSASAHITLQTREAAVGSFYRAVFVVPHGCAGSATTRIRVQIPEGVIDVKPMPKPGWNVGTVKAKYAKPYDFHGAELTEGVKEVEWSGGRLPDDFYDEFVVAMFLTGDLKPDAMLYFPTVQECEQGISRWIDIPVDPAQAHDSKWPAPGVKLLPRS